MEVRNLWQVVQPRLVEYSGTKLMLDAIATFTGSKRETVISWIDDLSLPNGARLIKLWHVLRIAGSPSPELSQLPEYNRVLSELFGLGVVSGKEAMELAGLSAKSEHKVYPALRGAPLMHPAFPSGDALEHMYAEQLVSRREEIATSLAEPKKVEQSVSQEVEQTVAVEFHGEPSIVLAAILSAAVPYVRYMNSDDVSAEDRSKFRSLIGPESLFELTNTLGALSSERARGLVGK